MRGFAHDFTSKIAIDLSVARLQAGGYMGFRPTVAQGTNFGARQGMASFAQIEQIRALWSEYARRL